MAWQKATGYGRHSLAETAIGCYKAIIGPKLRARILPAQQDETAIAAEVLNHMIRIAKLASIRGLTPRTGRDQYCWLTRIRAQRSKNGKIPECLADIIGIRSAARYYAQIGQIAGRTMAI